MEAGLESGFIREGRPHDRIDVAVVDNSGRSSTTVALVGHGIYDVINTKSVSQCGHWYRVYRVIGVLPGIANIHIEVDRDNQPAVVVMNAVPFGRAPELGVDFTRGGPIQVPPPGNLGVLPEVIQHVHERVLF